MQSGKINSLFNQSGAGSTPVIAAALPFFLPGNDVGIVIIHGYGGSIADYRTIGQLLHTDGYTIIGLRLAGHGQGQKVLRRITVAECQLSVADAVAELRKTSRHIFLLGSSFGGVLSLDYVAHHPDVAGMILVNTALSYSGAGKFQGILLRILRLFTPDYPKKGLTAEEKAYATKIGSSVAWPINGILATAKFSRNIVIPKLPVITTPALILHSENDPVVGIHNSEQLAKLLGSSIKEVMMLPVATHRPFRNQEANTYMASQVHRFIQRVLAKV